MAARVRLVRESQLSAEFSIFHQKSGQSRAKRLHANLNPPRITQYGYPMATFSIRLPFLHDGLPKSIFEMTQRSPLGMDGTRNGNARSNRRMKMERSSRNPKPVPTAISSKKD